MRGKEAGDERKKGRKEERKRKEKNHRAQDRYREQMVKYVSATRSSRQPSHILGAKQ